MKIAGYFFVLVFALTVVCKGNEYESLRIDFTDPIFSKLDDKGKDVIREYAQNYPKVKEFYTNIRMDVTRKLFRSTADKELSTYIPLNSPPLLEREELYEVRYNAVNDIFSRVDSRIRFIQGKNIQEDYTETIDILTPEMSYGLSKSRSNNQFYSLNMKRNHETLIRGDGVVCLEFDTAPFSVGPMPVEDFLFKPPYFAKDVPYFVTSARFFDDQDGRFVEIVCRTDILGLSPPHSSTWTIKLLRESWVIKDVFRQGWSGGGKNKFWRRYLCEYDGEFEGMPLLSSYQMDYGIYDTDEAQTERMLSRARYEVTKIVPGPVDLSEFDVAQFLPPGARIGEVTPAGLSTVRIVAIVIGILLVIFGIYMKIRIVLREKRKAFARK